MSERSLDDIANILLNGTLEGKLIAAQELFDLGRAAEPATVKIAAALNEASGKTAELLLGSLSRIGTKQALQAIYSAVTHPDKTNDIRICAIKAFENADDRTTAVIYLREALKQDSSPSFQSAIRWSIEDARGPIGTNPEALINRRKFSIMALDDILQKDPTILAEETDLIPGQTLKQIICDALWNRLIGDPAATVKEPAAVLLGKIGDTATLNDLRTLEPSTSLLVANAVAAAIKQIEDRPYEITALKRLPVRSSPKLEVYGK